MKMLELRSKFNKLPENFKIYVLGISICLSYVLIKQLFLILISFSIGLILVKIVIFKKNNT